MTFGLPKLTKLNMNSNNSKSNHSDQKSNNLVQTSQTASPATPTQPVYATPNNTNQINVTNSTSTKLMYASKTSQLKTPSVQINKPQSIEQPSDNVMDANSAEVKSSQTTMTTTTTSKLSKMPTQIASKLSSTKNAIQTFNSANKPNLQSPTSTDQTQLSTFQSTAQAVRSKPLSQTKIDSIQQDSNKPHETNNGTNVSSEEKEAKKPVCNELSNTDDELESLNLDDLSNERLIDDNDEEFQKFLNSPEENSNYIKPISMSIVDNKR